MLSVRAKQLKPSATLALNATAMELQRQGKDIIRLVTGEPDTGSPAPVRLAAIQAIESGLHDFYTSTAGVNPLKEAICKKLERDNKIHALPNEIVVTNGGKQALFNTLGALIDAGDEVLIPSPYWVSYVDMVEVWGGQPVMIDTTSNDFRLTSAMVEASLSSQTKVLLLNSPSNPTGAVMDPVEIEKIASLAMRHDFYVISDEVYEHFLYDGVPMFSIGSVTGMKERVFTVNAVSKTYGMTGWRVGYVHAPQSATQALTDLQSHSTSNVCAIAQQAAIAALNGPQDCVQKMLHEFTRRRDFVCDELRKIKGLVLKKPDGAFYVFPDVSSFYDGVHLKNSFDFCEYLLNTVGVAVAPGGAFGVAGDDCFRLSYAASMEDLQKAMIRIRKATDELRNKGIH